MSNPKKRLRDEADKLWKYKIIGDRKLCEVCEKEPVETGHHFFPKSAYGHLRYELTNGIAIGRTCHFRHHHVGDPTIHQTIIEKRGEKWYSALKAKALQRPKASFQTVRWYKQVIKQLE